MFVSLLVCFIIYVVSEKFLDDNVYFLYITINVQTNALVIINRKDFCLTIPYIFIINIKSWRERKIMLQSVKIKVDKNIIVITIFPDICQAMNIFINMIYKGIKN